MAQPKLAFSDSLLPVGAAEIAARLGVKPQTVHTWRHRNVMPSPRWTVSGQPAWDWNEIEAWGKRTGRLQETNIHVDMLTLEGSGWEGNLEQMRTDRFLQAERLGTQASQKILFPLVFCIMPAIFLTIFGPLGIRYITGGFESFL